MMNKIRTLCVTLLMVLLSMFATSCFAQVFTGVAVIENNNVKQAEEKAVLDAKRACVEETVGTFIKAKTETVNYAVVSDQITASTEGCVLVKKIISRKRKGDIFEVVMDLEANRNTIEMTAEDIKNQILHSAGTSRFGIDIAVINGDDLTDDSIGDIIIEKLRLFNYRTQGNDAIDEYLVAVEKMSPPPSNREIRLKLRQYGRTSGPNAAKCLIRGKITTEPALSAGNGLYKVTAYFNGQIVGYDSNIVDAVAHYAIEVGESAKAAKLKAQKKVALEAAEVLAKQTAETLQREGTVW